ncbi:hypothetical protein BHE74_00000478 [Ensete ventricosum]|nr:hypothetical protein BHE74_00000478 [Ensete ventricosum]RZR84993.1 hypothetical protein BHM03_00011914 [Ensete ventricosum]
MSAGASGELDHILGVDIVWGTSYPAVLLRWWNRPTTCPLTPFEQHRALPCFSDARTERRLAPRSRLELTWGCLAGSNVVV